MKKRYSVAFAALFTVCSAALLCACGKSYESYENAASYRAGESSVSSGSVDSIEIDWSFGAVSLKSASSSESIVFSETFASGEKNADTMLHYAISGRTLSIKFAASGAAIPSGLQKNLTVTLPTGKFLSDLDVETVSGNVSVENISIGDVELESDSGNLLLSGAPSSGVNLSTRTGQIEVKGVAGNEVKLETVSGKIYLSGTRFSDLEIETRSGPVEWHPLADVGFNLLFESSRGTLIDHLGLTASGEKRYIFGDGAAKAEVETSSSDLYITAVEG